MADDDRWIELDEHATAHYRQWYEASLIVADATEVMAKARAAIQDFLETHTSNVGSVNGVAVVRLYAEHAVAGFDETRLKQERPGVYQQYRIMGKQRAHVRLTRDAGHD